MNAVGGESSLAPGTGNRRKSRRYPDLTEFSFFAAIDDPCGACNVAHVIFADSLHRVAHPVLLLGSSSRVIFANRSARRTLATTNLLSLRHNCLRIKDGSVFVSALSLHDPTQGHSIHVLGPCSLLRSRLVVEFVAVPVNALSTRSTAPGLWMLQIATIDRATSADINILRKIFGFTPAEAALVSLLHRGLSMQAAAQSLGRSTHTAKTQLRNAFLKSQTRTQAALLLTVDRVARFGQ